MLSKLEMSSHCNVTEIKWEKIKRNEKIYGVPSEKMKFNVQCL
jgi:hypothetical protein